jgi:hypothetical protein
MPVSFAELVSTIASSSPPIWVSVVVAHDPYINGMAFRLSNTVLNVLAGLLAILMVAVVLLNRH